MSENEIRCRYCGDRVDPNDRKVVYAVQRGEVTIIQASGPTSGGGDFFHRTCLPFVRDYDERQSR